jgi:DNA polymerase-3 subunit alpha
LDQIDAKDQRVLLCSRFRTNLAIIEKMLDNDESDQVMGFFKSNNYHLPTPDEMFELHKGHEIELENTLKIAEMCGTYSVLSSPIIPKFCDNPNQVLKSLCVAGWNEKILPKIDTTKHAEYQARLDKELRVLTEANLAGYFLTVHDYVSQARNRGELVVLRGSGTGCLVSYLIGVSDVDPMPCGLLFERFYNAGRNTKDHVSMPDMDCDFESNKRYLTTSYIRKRHGDDKVAQVATFHRLQGRSAIKAVLRAHDACDFSTMNRITKPIPDEAKISDDLQEMKDAGLEPSVLQWTLENNGKDLAEFCFIDDAGKLCGDYAAYFEQAKRLEGCKEKRGTHAAALIISDIPLSDVCPMLYDDKSEEMICGMEFSDLESMGLVKYDILSSDVLDKLNGVKRLLATGAIE